jgi:hypothetical protein
MFILLCVGVFEKETVSNDFIQNIVIFVSFVHRLLIYANDISFVLGKWRWFIQSSIKDHFTPTISSIVCMDALTDKDTIRYSIKLIFL